MTTAQEGSLCDCGCVMSWRTVCQTEAGRRCRELAVMMGVGAGLPYAKMAHWVGLSRWGTRRVALKALGKGGIELTRGILQEKRRRSRP
jgi:hypothetical protein